MDLLTLAQTVGLPVAMVLISLLAGYNRKWVWGTELTACENRMVAQGVAYEARLVQQAEDYEKRLDSQRQSHFEREAAVAAAAEKWQNLLFESIPALKGLTEAVARQAAQTQRGA